MSQIEHKIKFVSLISRQDQPLYIQAFDLPENTTETKDANEFLRYNYLSHMALDIFASGASMSLREQQQQQDSEKTDGAILLLFQEENCSVYGYQSNTGLKIVVGLGARDSPDSQLQEKSGSTDKKMQLKELFLDVQKCYIRAICNPFNYLDGSPQTNEKTLQSPKFDRSIKATVAQWNEI